MLRSGPAAQQFTKVRRRDLAQAVYDTVRMAKVLRLRCARKRDGFHPGAPRRFDPVHRVFHHHARLRIYPQTLRRQLKHLRVRLAASHIGACHDGRETLRSLQLLEQQLDVFRRTR
jgi:hypothetical protein